ncbi:MAG: NADH-quinone oxidoreductase subunit H [Eubacterium sp.]|nr:NADH-quinone oxidoreductase subunit H [Eubacterium sp.]
MTGRIISVIIYVLCAPFLGGILDGVSRKISARMQGRIGPPILQPLYDVRKLLNKQVVAVSVPQSFLLICYLVLMILSGAIFFSGNDLLMCVFVLGTASTFLYFATIVNSSPYNTIAASRELIQIMAYEPAVLLAGVGFYLASGSFSVRDIALADHSMLLYTPGFFIAFVFVLTIKMRKSPFDISTSHHAHQELVRGVTTELGARYLALYTIAEWYENVFLLGMVSLFFLNRNTWSIPAALLLTFLVFFLEILIDNTNARMKWESMFKLSWEVTLLAAGVNLLVLMLIK